MSKSSRGRPKVRTLKTPTVGEVRTEQGAPQKRLTRAARAPSTRIAVPPAGDTPAVADLGRASKPGVADAVYAAAWTTGATKVGGIARSELTALLVSPAAWLAAAVFTFIVSSYGFIGTVIPGGQASMNGVFAVIANYLLLLLVPLITMRAFAEERRLGTIELLLTSPVRDWELVMGKWLGAFAFYLLLIATTLVYVLLLAIYVPDKFTIWPAGIGIHLGALDFGLVAATYVGLLLAGGAAIAIGVLASSLTRSRAAAFFLSLVTLLVIWYAGRLLGLVAQPNASLGIDYAGSYSRYQAFGLGQVTLRDTAYFLSLVVAALLVTTRLVASRRRR